MPDVKVVKIGGQSILDRELFHAWSSAKNLQRITIVNGLVPGQLTRAIYGDDVGTVITKAAP